jgi:hypothetical protein
VAIKRKSARWKILGIQPVLPPIPCYNSGTEAVPPINTLTDAKKLRKYPSSKSISTVIAPGDGDFERAFAQANIFEGDEEL